MSDLRDLRQHSVRTLAWLGDAEFEQIVRRRVALLGDYPVDRLDRARALVSRAEAQAELVAAIEPALREEEAAVVRRARNASVRSGGRVKRDVKAYRAATGLEALVAWWVLGGPEGEARLEAVLGAHLNVAVARALERSEKPRRG